MNEYYMNVSFEKGKIDTNLFKLVQNDYNSTKINFTFDKEGTIQFKMLLPDKTTAYIDEIVNNEVVLGVGLLSQNGTYKIEICVNGVDNRLTDYATHEFIVRKELINTDEIVEPDDRVPILDNLINEVNQAKEDVEDLKDDIDTALEEVNQAIEETNNLDLDVNKIGKEATVEITKKNGTTKEVKIYDGVSLQFMWQGTSLGIKTDDMQDYIFVDLQGIQGIPGPQGEPFRIKKTYSSVAEMNADFDNMNVGDYVMIASTVEVEDNAKLYTRGDYQWIFITDFSGATGIKGETGATPIIHIGTVTSGNEPSVTISGTAENPIFNFVLKTGPQGEVGPQGQTGATGNGIASITKTSTSGLVDTYTITYTNGTTTTFQITNGEDGEVTQAQLDETNRAIDYYKSTLNALPKVEGEGTSITLDDTAEAPMPMTLSPSALSQYTTTGKNKLNVPKVYSVTGTIYKYVNLSSGVAYTLSASSADSQGTATYYLVRLIDSNGQDITSLYNFSASTLKANFIPARDVRQIAFYSQDNYGHSENVTTVFNELMIRESSITDDTYESYTGGIPAPNPDYPQDIHTISGDNEIKIENKNLFNYDTFKGTLSEEVNNGVLCLKLSGNTRTYNFNGKENQRYSFQFRYISKTTSDIGAFEFVYTDNTTSEIKYTGQMTSSGTVYSAISTANKTVRAIKWNAWSSGQYLYIDKNSFQLEENSKTDYTPHQEQSLPLNLPVENLFDITGNRTGGSDYYTFNNETINIISATTNIYTYWNQEINVSSGVYTFMMNILNGTTRPLLRFIDSNNNILSNITISGWTWNSYYNGYWIDINKVGNNIFNINIPNTVAKVKVGFVPAYPNTSFNQILFGKGNTSTYTLYGTLALEYCKIPNTDYEDEFVIPQNQLFNKDTVTNGYYLNTNGGLDSNANYCVSDYIEVIPNQQYYIPIRGTTRTKYYLADKTAYSNTWDVTDTAQVIAIPSNVKYIRMSIAIAGSTAVDLNTFMFNKGNQPLPYEPYNPDDKWYLKKNIGKVVLDGTETNIANPTDIGNNLYRFPIANILSDNKSIEYVYGGTLGFCNYFKYLMQYSGSTSTERIYTDGGGINLFTFEATTVEELKNWLSTHNTTVDYILATPQYIPLNDTLQSQLTEIYKWVKAYQEQTNISQVNNDLPFVIKASAVYDLNKLLARVVALEEE